MHLDKKATGNSFFIDYTERREKYLLFLSFLSRSYTHTDIKLHIQNRKIRIEKNAKKRENLGTTICE
jgi:hypothetical protein